MKPTSIRNVAAALALSLALSLGLGLTLGACAADVPPPVVPPVTTALPDANDPKHGAQGALADPTRTRLVTRKDAVVDTLHGVAVSDPYRWLEDGDAAEVKSWTDAQNARTRAVLDAIPGRDQLKADVTDLLQVGSVAVPAVRRTRTGVRYFHTRREGAQNQPTLYVRDGHAGKDRPLIDVASLSEDGTSALDWWFPSNDGSLIAWGRSESGSEDSVLHMRDVATGKDLSERIDRTRHCSVAWLPDGKSFYYSRYPAKGTVPAGEERYHSRIYLHRLGTDPSTDKLVFGEGRDKTDTPEVMISPNGRWLVVRVHMGWDRSEVYLRDLSLAAKGGDTPWVAVAANQHAIFDPEPRDDRLWIMTNDGAPRYRLYAVEYAKPARSAWREVLPETKDVLVAVRFSRTDILAEYMRDASSRLERFSVDGKSKGAIALPAIGSATLSAFEDGDEYFVGFSSFVVPPEIHRLDLRQPAPKLEIWDRLASKAIAQDADTVEVTQMFATSKDGTRVPMFVIAKKGLPRDGRNPTVLYGYGGFNINQTPAFSTRVLASVRRGAVWVSTILRGGGELGEAWHAAGMLEKKQNVFDDFFACAETLIKERITSADRLAAMGGSNGGLLVAAAVTQRPDLFRAGISLVPLTDMVRYHHFRIAKLWIPEYGDPDKADHFKFLHAYSPYHRAVNGTKYPALLFTTAESDTRVDPMHARKMAARMQEAQGDPSRPVLLRVETKAGHGAGKPVAKVAEELTDELSFTFRELGVGTGRGAEPAPKP